MLDGAHMATVTQCTAIVREGTGLIQFNVYTPVAQPTLSDLFTTFCILNWMAQLALRSNCVVYGVTHTAYIARLYN